MKNHDPIRNVDSKTVFLYRTSIKHHQKLKKKFELAIQKRVLYPTAIKQRQKWRILTKFEISDSKTGLVS